MAGYSERSLEQKLGLKVGYVVFLDRAPDGFTLDAPTIRRLPPRIDMSLTFHTSEQTLAKRLPELVARTAPAGAIWVCWPKKAAKVATDLDEAGVRRAGLSAGLVDVKIAAIDSIWSGLKFVRRLADR
ncbi:MAG: DUF3052 domain-containing protein [Actinomycetota bacterium]|nr:DUF3052 domain-containing protein [Actinomycetota bacterium]